MNIKYAVRKREQICKMLLKDLIEKNKITEDLLKNVNNKILHNKVRGISSNSKEIKKNVYILSTLILGLGILGIYLSL